MAGTKLERPRRACRHVSRVSYRPARLRLNVQNLSWDAATASARGYCATVLASLMPPELAVPTQPPLGCMLQSYSLQRWSSLSKHAEQTGFAGTTHGQLIRPPCLINYLHMYSAFENQARMQGNLPVAYNRVHVSPQRLRNQPCPASILINAVRATQTLNQKDCPVSAVCRKTLRTVAQVPRRWRDPSRRVQPSHGLPPLSCLGYIQA